MVVAGTAFQLKINGIDRTPPGASEDDAAEWNVTWEERIDGVGVASGTIQDRTNSGEEFAKERDEVEMLVNGLRVFHGEVTRAQLDLPAGRRFPKWKITASDFNTIPDLRLVGAPDGSDFQTIDGGKTYHPIDPHAHCRATDRLTIEWLFEKYAAMPNGDPIDATTFVRHYVNKFVLYNKRDKPILWWTNATLRAAISELAGMAGFPIYDWMDPDDKWHHVNFKDFNAGLGSLPRLFPRSSSMVDAPAEITDVTADLDGSHIGGRNLSIEYDATFMPEQVYVAGVTDYIRNGAVQGSGFANGVIRDISKRQILVDAQALTEAQRDATGRSYLQFNTRGRIKGTVTVGSPTEAVDGWRCGQLLKITDARWGLSGKGFPIQRVSGSLKAGNDFRVYTLEFGDAPLGRFGAKHKTEPQRLHTKSKRIPATEHKIIWPTTHLRPDTEYTLHSQMLDTTGAAFPQAGVEVGWGLSAYLRTGALWATGSIAPYGAVATMIIPGVVINATTNVTDRHGMTAALLTTGPETDIFYHVRAYSEAQHADTAPST